MRAGKLRHKINIERPGTAEDSTGATVASPYTVFLNNIWADVSPAPMSGREQVAGQQTKNPITHEVRVRYRAGITSAMRVVFDGRYFNIMAIVDKEERNVELTLMCEEGKASG